MEKKIIIFTNRPGVNRVLDYGNSELQTGFFKTIISKRIIVYDERLKELVKSNSIADGNIFIINDNIDNLIEDRFDNTNQLEELFYSFINGIKPEDLYILKHREPKFNFTDTNPNFKFQIENIIVGSNEPHNKYYPKVLRAIEAHEGDVFDKIYNIFFMPKQEIVLEFLNNCIVSEPELPQEISNEIAIVNQYKIWKIKKNSTELETLRDLLLKWVEQKEIK